MIALSSSYARAGPAMAVMGPGRTCPKPTQIHISKTALRKVFFTKRRANAIRGYKLENVFLLKKILVFR